MEIKISDSNSETRIRTLSSLFDVKFSEDCGEYKTRNISNKFMEGEISMVDFDHGLGMIILSIKTIKPVHLEFSKKVHPDLMHYFNNIGDTVKLSGEDLGHHSEDLASGESFLSATKLNNSIYIELPEKCKIELIVLEVQRKKIFGKIKCDLPTLPDDLFYLFKDTDGNKPMYFKTTYNPKIWHTLDQIKNNGHVGLEKKIFYESKCFTLLYTLINSYRREYLNQHDNTLTEDDINKIMIASKYIDKNISDDISINAIAHKVGLNKNKLQNGFKTVFNLTAGKYIRKQKLDKAHELLESGSYTVGQAVNAIGMTNKGYFAKIFKKQYGILPKDLLKLNLLKESNHSD